MFNIGGAELLIILLVALIFLGPQRLPEVARQVGQTVTQLRSLAQGFQAEIEAAAQPDSLLGPTPAIGEPVEAATATSPEQRTSPAADATDTPDPFSSMRDPSVDPLQPTDPSEIARRARETRPVDGDDEVSAGGPEDLAANNQTANNQTATSQMASVDEGDEEE